MGYPVYNFTMERVMKHEYDVLVIGGDALRSAGAF